jgi:hypothetical protein
MNHEIVARADLGRARASRAGKGALALANLSSSTDTGSAFPQRKVRFGEAPKPAREGACAPRTST